MYSYRYYPPSGVRDGARQVLETVKGEARAKLLSDLGMTSQNAWYATRLKKGEDPETLRGIDTCIRILQASGISIESTPVYRVTQIQLAGEDASINP